MITLKKFFSWPEDKPNEEEGCFFYKSRRYRHYRLRPYVFCWTPMYARAQAQPEIRQSVEQKFEQYRAALKEEHQIDIKNFKDRIPGGVADGKAITNYDLNSSFWG